jgi:phage shock protein A
MGIFQKLTTLIRSNINDAIAKAENPEKMLNQVLLDMREQLARAKQEVAVAIADERKLKAQMEEEQKQALEWEGRAMLAIRESRDDLAKQALLRHQEHAERAVSLNDTWQKQSGETEKLKESLRQLNDKIEEAKRKKNLLIAKQKRAQAQKRIHDTMAGLNDRSAFDTFERMAEKIEETERQAIASAELSETLSLGGSDSLEKEFAKLGGPASVEIKLLQMKQQMGIQTATTALPGSSAAALSSGSTPGNGETRQLRSTNPDPEIVKEAELEEEA